MKTIENLLTAFAGESQANRKYLAFAKKADKEGFKNLARLFTAIAEAETSHALKHLETAGKVGSTLENVNTAVEGENYEVTQMYPDFIETAKAEGQKKALKSFEYAIEAEKVHHKALQELKALVEQGKDMEDKEVLMCPVCGWVGTEPAPDKCPICGASSKVYKSY